MHVNGALQALHWSLSPPLC